MKTVLMILATMALAACQTPPIQGQADMRTVLDDNGEKVFVAPMPAKNSWGATRYSFAPFILPNPAIEIQVLTRAIEQVSGCRVVTSDYNRDNANLYAVVDCTRP